MEPPATPPAYEQVKAYIRSRVSSGEWKPGDAVPSEAELQNLFKISRMTVHRALRELAAEGMVTRIQGSGTRVANLHRIASRLTIRDIHDEVAERGNAHSTQVLLVAKEKAVASVAGALGLRTGVKVFHTMLIHFENGMPIQQAPALAPFTPPLFTPSQVTSPSPTPAPAGRETSAPAQVSRPRPGAPDGRDDVFKPRPDAAAPVNAPAAPRLDLDAVRQRAREIATEGSGSRGLLPLQIQVPAERKSKLAESLEKAVKPDCRNAYADMGLLAVPALVAGAVADVGCRW